MKDHNRRTAARWLTSLSLVASLCAGIVPAGVVTAQKRQDAPASPTLNRRERRALESSYPTLARYGRDLSELARQGALTPASPAQKIAIRRIISTLR